MRASEVFLRLGSSLVAWMVLYAYFIWLAVLHKAGCQAGSDEMHRLLMGILPFAVGSAFLLRLTRPFTEIHSMLRWLAVPLALLLPVAVPAVWHVMSAVTLDGSAICGTGQRAPWQILWAPLQLLTIGTCIWMIVTVWRSVAEDRNDTAVD